MSTLHYLVTTKKVVPLTEENFPLQIFRKNEKIWVHLTPKNEEELGRILEKYEIHPLTIEDVFSTTNRIKLERFPHYVYFSVRGFHLEEGHLFIKAFNFIVFRKTLITITLEKRNTIFDMIENWDRFSYLLKKGPEFILHRILDVETDRILAIVHRLDEMVDGYETQLLDFALNVNIKHVFEIRSALQHIRKVIILHKELLDELQVRLPQFFRGEAKAFFTDVRDHSLKIIDMVDSIIQAISSALEAYLTISTRRTNDIMRILTILTALMLPMTLITGIYGMNFEKMPFLSHDFGFWGTMIFMGLIGISMTFYFKYKKWL